MSEIEEPLGGQGEKLESASIEQQLTTQLEDQLKTKKQNQKKQ